MITDDMAKKTTSTILSLVSYNIGAEQAIYYCDTTNISRVGYTHIYRTLKIGIKRVKFVKPLLYTS